MSQKSDEKAKELKTKGNSFYAKKQFFNALICYNQALCFAQTGSEQEALIYANRAAVYLENRLYEECLSNLKKAEDLNYPRPEVLKTRREKCYEMLGKQDDPKFKRHKFELVFAPHEKFPFLSECLEFSKDSDGHPHIHTTRDLQVGDVIAFGEPFSPLIKRSSIFQRCNLCLKDNLFDLYPCETCTQGEYLQGV